jgi:uncharacterized protein (TIGR02444 family)
MRHEGGTSDSAGEAFWRFSLALYARPGVAAALIALQDRTGRNVNLMLFALWLGATRVTRLDAAGLATGAAALAELDTAVVAPLRALRRRLKSSVDRDVAALRQEIAQLEVRAERRAQYRLAARLPGGRRAGGDADRLAAAAANLALYLGDAAGCTEAELLHRELGALTHRL